MAPLIELTAAELKDLSGTCNAANLELKKASDGENFAIKCGKTEVLMTPDQLCQFRSLVCEGPKPSVTGTAKLFGENPMCESGTQMGKVLEAMCRTGNIEGAAELLLAIFNPVCDAEIAAKEVK